MLLNNLNISGSDMVCEGSTSPPPVTLDCGKCAYTAPDLPAAALHRTLHSEEGVLTCSRCGFLTRSKVTMSAHKKTGHAPTIYQCPMCSYSSVNARHVTAHVDHCTGDQEEEYECPYCTEIFNQGE